MHRIHEISNVPEAKHAHGHIRPAQKKPIARNRAYRTRLAASFANFPLSSHSYLINYFSNDSAASDNNKYTRTEIFLVALPLAKLHKQCSKRFIRPTFLFLESLQQLINTRRYTNRLLFEYRKSHIPSRD